LRLAGKLIDPDKTYKVAGWAPIGEYAQGEPIWDVVENYLKAKKTVAALTPNVPKLVGVQGNPGIAGIDGP
jgi:sulfur-oxidizing protein SoxB